jgi:uncharacterized protein YxjI
MHAILRRNLFLVKEHIGIFKAANEYDVYDPTTGQPVLHCREPDIGPLTRLLRFTDYKRYTPFAVEITTPVGEQVLSVKRGIAFWLSRVEVFDEHGRLAGTFKQRLLSIGGKFDVLDAQGNEVCVLKGSWTSWEFRFLKGEREVAKVTKKWAGLGRELFTTADNYMLTIDERLAADSSLRLLILGAVMCIDMVLKE